jgi:hypothetical protein
MFRGKNVKQTTSDRVLFGMMTGKKTFKQRATCAIFVKAQYKTIHRKELEHE